MTEPLVSIIIPCFNAQKYVGSAIQSALDQSYKNTEVVVIDDGSTDQSIDVIRSFGSRIRFESGTNRGGCAARNRGLEIASGSLIQFLDADDFLQIDKLEIQIPAALADVNRLTFCDCKYSDPKLVHPHHRRTDASEDSVLFMLRGGLQTSAPIHQRWWLEKTGGFRFGLTCAQEFDLHMRIAAIGVKFHRIPKTLYTVRWVPNSVSSSHERVLDQYLDIVRNTAEVLIGNGQMTADRKRAMAALLAKSARAYIRMGQHGKATAYLNAAQEFDSEDGIADAYGKMTNSLRKLIGPVATEYLAGVCRSH